MHLTANHCKHRSLYLKALMFALHKRRLRSSRGSEVRTTNVRWKSVDKYSRFACLSGGTTMRNALHKGPTWPESQLLTVVICSLLHLVPSPLPSLSHIPMVLPVLPGITSQIKYLYSNPCLRVHFWGNPT